MTLLQRIDENHISGYELFGNDNRIIEDRIKGLIDIMMGEVHTNVDYDFFDLRGTVLLHGIPGTGKTSVMNNCMKYALVNYGADCYELSTSDIVESELGKATKNLADSLKEFELKDKGILFIDEVDRLCVNRKGNELSELKRMLIELMQFFDRQKSSNKRVVLCCTNVIDQVDEALKRRFSICEEVHKPEISELIEFANKCMEKANMKGKIKELKSGIVTFDDVKKVFRNALLSNSNIGDFFGVEE